jgi:hypothetical protein
LNTIYGMNVNLETNMPFSFDLMTPREVAEILRVSLKVLSRITATGAIPHIKIANKTRYPAADIRKLLGGLDAI